MTASVHQPRKAAAAAFIGSTVEWYDFYIFATASALVFGQVFFPTQSVFLATMASFGTFAVGCFARPFGAVLFGHFGDRLGRKGALVTTLFLMGTVTILIGLLPGYNQLGIWAPILLVALRLVQGVAVGGEWGGAVLMAGEHAPAGRGTFFASFAQLGSPMGLLLSIIAFWLVSQLDQQDFLSWGWRVPFLASFVLLAVGIAIRVGIAESPAFERAAQPVEKHFPLLTVLREHGRTLLLCIGANAIGISGFYFANTFMINYATQFLAIPKATILGIQFFAAIIQIIVQLGAAKLTERFGTARVLSIALGAAIISPFVMFSLVETRVLHLMAIGIFAAVACMGAIYAVIAGFVSARFPVGVRYSAISIAYQVSGAVFGGLTPLVGAWLTFSAQGAWWPAACCYAAIATLSLLCVLRLRRTTPADTF